MTDINDLIQEKAQIYPKHLAVNISSLKDWEERHKRTINEANSRNINLIKELISLQTKHDITILTINIPKDAEHGFLNEFFKNLADKEEIHKNQVKIFVIGKWYETNEELITTIKNMMEKTSEYDKYFLNFCINYNGQEELKEAVELIGRKIMAYKMRAESINNETIKENLYSSFFIPPDLIIETEKRYSGLLLWDSQGAIIFYTNRRFLDITMDDVEKALGYFNKLS